ncbi:MAG: hypothetical protein ACD_69C00318G0002 [uncultured bacterium]|nr:MAG: hypothetical protein ACD_69C00318G0002 [uncultured bacterium]
MIKKIPFYLMIVPLMVFCVAQPVFAGFIDIEVVNKTGKSYEDVELVITSEGFDSMPGTIKLGEIGPELTPRSFKYKYVWGKLPLTWDMPDLLGRCNLNVFVVAGPKEGLGGVLTRRFENIITGDPLLATEDEPRHDPLKLMHGIRLPGIKIIILGKSQECPEGIEAEFKQIETDDH